MGKTVAMAQWANETSDTGVWMRLGDGVTGAVAFIGQLALTLSDARMLDGDNPLRFAGDALRFSDDPWELATRGLRRLQPITIAIDEVDRLDDDAIGGLVQLVADLPDLRLRATTRTRGPFADPLTALVVDIDIVTQTDLLLTDAEAAQIVGHPADSPAVTDVLDAGGRAPALARMIALTRPSSSSHLIEGTISRLESDRHGTGPTVVDIVDSLLRSRSTRWPEGFVEFIEVAAVADGIRPALATRLTGRQDAAELLDLAETEGLGYWHADPGSDRARFGFSPFIRSGLEAALRRRLDAEELRRLALTVARADLADGRAYPALRGAVEHGDWELASEVMRVHWSDLFDYAAQVRQLFVPVSPVALRRYPLLAMFLAIIFNARGSHRMRAVEYFALAAYGTRTRRSAGTPAERALLMVVESTSLRLIGRHASADKVAREGYAAVRALTLEEQDELGRNASTAYNQIGTTLFYSGDTDAALDCFRRSTSIGDARGLRAGLQGLALTAGAHAVAGDMPEARAVVAEAAQRPWPDGWRDGYAGSFLVLAEAMLAIEQGDADAADGVLRTLDRHRPTIEHWALLLHVDVMILLLKHDADGAVALIDRTIAAQRPRHALSPLTTARLRHTRALAELARGEVGAAEAAVRRGDDARTMISRARAAIAGGDPERALRLLATVSRTEGSSRTKAEILALTAAGVSMVDEDGDGTAVAATRLAAHLRRTEQRTALALVPGLGLDALATGARGVDAQLDGWIADARRLALIAPRRVRPRLTPRELVIAEELVRSETVTAMAERLTVSPNTVKSQLRSLYRKLDVSTRADALGALAAWGFAVGVADVAGDDAEQRQRAQ
jgi:LuxR family maltose regulon positive regulatory protein